MGQFNRNYSSYLSLIRVLTLLIAPPGHWVKVSSLQYIPYKIHKALFCIALFCITLWFLYWLWDNRTVYPKKYAHGFCFAVLCCGYTLTDFPISIRLTSLALWQSSDCPSASKATLMNMDKYFMWIHYERLHNHNKAKHNKTVCIFLGIFCTRAFEFNNLFNVAHAKCWS